MLNKTAMYGGSFNPLHMGHLAIILKAAARYERLYIVISYSKTEEIPVQLRQRWIQHYIKDLPNVKIILLENNFTAKELYNNSDEAWKTDAGKIKEIIGRPIDTVICGSDYMHTGRFEGLYPESEVEYADRGLLPISSTAIRESPFTYWDYIPTAVRPYYVKKILVVGGESTGKSTLCRNLAALYNTNYVEESGRDVCAEAGGEEMMLAEDFHKCLLYQKADELKAVEGSNKLLFVDTDALTTKFYCQFLLADGEDLKKCEGLADAIACIHDYDLVLFLEPSVPFVQDGTRNEKILQNRILYSEKIKELLTEKGIAFVSIGGDYHERLVRAMDAVDKIAHQSK